MKFLSIVLIILAFHSAHTYAIVKYQTKQINGRNKQWITVANIFFSKKICCTILCSNLLIFLQIDEHSQ